MLTANTPIEQLPNLGPMSAKQLAKINVRKFSELKNKGAIASYAELLKLKDFKPSLNFLYALMGAIEGKHWTEYKQIKGKILIQLESFLEIDNQF